MKIKKGVIIEAKESELFKVWLDKGYDEVMSFNTFVYQCEELGTKITERDVTE